MKHEYSDDFEVFWSLYPPRDGANPKRLAFKAWRARIKEGISHSQLVEAVKHYGAYLCRKGKLGTEYVLLAATFLGPNERWKGYEPPPPQKTPGNGHSAPKPAIPDEPFVPPEVGQAYIREILAKLGVAKGMPGSNGPPRRE